MSEGEIKPLSDKRRKYAYSRPTQQEMLRIISLGWNETVLGGNLDLRNEWRTLEKFVLCKLYISKVDF